MSILTILLLLSLIFLVLLSGFLSGSETSITAASKARIISKIKKIPLVISDQGGLTTHPDLKNASVFKKFLRCSIICNCIFPSSIKRTVFGVKYS